MTCWQVMHPDKTLVQMYTCTVHIVYNYFLLNTENLEYLGIFQVLWMFIVS